MGNLPVARLQPQRPFLRCGVDFAGPVQSKERGRGKRSIKVYIAVFVCMATKAIHIELVGDLSCEAFIGALKRFVSRRGNVAEMHSDNATNFVGADNELRKVMNSTAFQSHLVETKVNWKFIPPRAPHFGGIWEAGIRSVKTHIKRVIGEAQLSYEELYTLLTCIEAVLNSRPLIPLSDDTTDLRYLSPGDVLIGGPLTAPVDHDYEDVNPHRLSRWQYVEKLRQHFWKRWSQEYLTHLQQRTKWQQASTREPQVGNLVVLKEDNVPPLRWQLGRITALHPGPDGKTRVVSVRCKNGILKRAINKVCALPTD